MNNISDTITAIATPIGNAGVSIIRLSGDNAFNIINKIFLISLPYTYLIEKKNAGIIRHSFQFKISPITSIAGQPVFFFQIRFTMGKGINGNDSVIFGIDMTVSIGDIHAEAGCLNGRSAAGSGKNLSGTGMIVFETVIVI